ncbi:unknown protein [Oryza sativa Japonica Group]|uniref:Os01g0881800 protein n=1 Tax=Oryza sativa subsp. japonica TaxID=39947 RepID=Q5NA21_ORYSJ|nr:unknown protein [Oryza sativa Japonica Group]BAD82565.1 unknown protein [Oryza sativa Japonica Group]BAH91408.1 Os01g0881800 [Oryza sativa Japonica Group]|eukprot:NP_001172678.1 Os01g0881800 [Oryza sativa Japonica Group]
MRRRRRGCTWTTARRGSSTASATYRNVLAGKVLAIQLGSLGTDQRSGDEADGRGQRGEPVSPLLVGLPLDVSTHMHCLLLPLVLASRSPASPHLSPLADCLGNQQENAQRRCLPTRVWLRRCRLAQHADRVHRRRRRLPRPRRSSRLQRRRRRKCRRSRRRMLPSSRGCRRESRWRDASGPYAFVGAAGERRRRVRRGRQRGRGAQWWIVQSRGRGWRGHGHSRGPFSSFRRPTFHGGLDLRRRRRSGPRPHAAVTAPVPLPGLRRRWPPSHTRGEKERGENMIYVSPT